MKKESLSIKHWSEDDKPREKLLNQGKQLMTDSELLAILIGSGSIGESAIALCQKILKKYDNNLSKLARASVKELINFKGIGEAKAITIVAALELSNRRKYDNAEIEFIKTSEDAHKILAPLMEDLLYEEFWVVFLNNANKIISKRKMSVGGVNATIVDVRIIFKEALEAQASKIVLAHNHPSGRNQPSLDDLNLTKKLIEAGKILDISILDHIIISENKYYSFSDNGKLV